MKGKQIKSIIKEAISSLKPKKLNEQNENLILEQSFSLLTVEGCTDLFVNINNNGFSMDPSQTGEAVQGFFAAAQDVGINSMDQYCNGPCEDARHPFFSSDQLTFPLSTIPNYQYTTQDPLHQNLCNCCDIIATANTAAADPGVGPVFPGAGPSTPTTGGPTPPVAPMSKAMKPGMKPMKPGMKPMMEQVERLQKLANIKNKK